MPDDGGSVLAAAASVRLTPPSGLPMGGYAARSGNAVGALDDLEANLLWLTDGEGGTVVWVALDVLAVVRGLRLVIAKELGRTLGVSPDHVVVSASHTHSGPAGWHGQIHPVLPAELDDGACRRLVGSLGAAAGNIEPVPVALGWHEADVSGVGSNRHRPEGPHDRSTGVLTVRGRTDGRLVAVLFDHACHPTVLGPDNLHWSADWVGAARARVRTAAAAGPQPLPVVFLQGSAGDISTRFHRRGRDQAETVRLGSVVGDAVLDAVAAGTTELAPARIQAQRTSVTLPVAAPALGPVTAHVRAEAAQAPAGGTAPDRLEESRVEGVQARAAMLAADLPPELELPVTLVTVGERRWLHLPVEMFAGLGAQVVDGHPSLRLVGHSDAYCGYVADRASHSRGDYEALASFFDVEASEHLVTLCRRYVDSV